MQYLRDLLALRVCLVSPRRRSPAELKEASFGECGLLNALSEDATAQSQIPLAYRLLHGCGKDRSPSFVGCVLCV
eukprot:5136325-Alexandrium_andersonii.AAC.1